MKTILQALKSVSGYPLPQRTLESIAVDRGINIEDEATSEVMKSKDFKLAKADIFWWVATAPSVGEKGFSISLLSDDKKRLQDKANAIYKEYGDPAYMGDDDPEYGYKGDRL